jgi:hypothetical protein
MTATMAAQADRAMGTRLHSLSGWQQEAIAMVVQWIGAVLPTAATTTGSITTERRI